MNEVMMNIIRATEEHLEVVNQIVQITINTVYPRYYPKGAVDSFLSHHNDINIKTDIEKSHVYVLEVSGEIVGTGSIKENIITRLYISPLHQGKGYGRMIMDYLEDAILSEYDEVILGASLPALLMYLKRGYMIVEHITMITESGDYLCYNMMKLERLTLDEQVS